MELIEQGTGVMSKFMKNARSRELLEEIRLKGPRATTSR